jgi:hypothetical protein
LVSRLDGDVPLLSGLLSVYCWLCPGTLLELPPPLRDLLPHCGTTGAPLINKQHVDWLDTRPWFIAANRK